MAASYEINVEDVEPMSRTYQYRKVMKPMLERKRRARINKCLDELKDLMVSALQSEGETITKLEKADVLELTVRHLRKLKQHHALAIPAHNQVHEKFRAGFSHCAGEVSRFVGAIPGVDLHVSSRLLSHLSQCITQLDKPSPVTPTTMPSAPAMPLNIPRVYTPPASPQSKSPLPTVVATPQTTVVISSTPMAVSAVNAMPMGVTTPPSLVPADARRVSVPAESPVWRPW